MRRPTRWLPISLYGASKLGGEGLISAFCHLFDMQAWVFRLANVVGRRLTHGIILDFINKLRQNPAQLEILGDGSQQKPYIHVADCVDGMLFAVEHAKKLFNLLNLATSTSTRVTTIADMVVKAMGLKDTEYCYTGGRQGWLGDVPQVRLDVARMERLGWKPRFNSDEAVQQAINDMLGK